MRLDLADIQGNLLRGYRLPFARYAFFSVSDATRSRAFLKLVHPLITSSEWWDDGKPQWTLNIALTLTGLEATGLPRAALNSFPLEFAEGMAKRSAVLGDTGPSAPERWENLWRGRIDILMQINALSTSGRDLGYAAVMTAAQTSQGVALVGFQDAAALVKQGSPAAIEHFGYTDGFSQPDFVGGQTVNSPGDGKIGKGKRWEEINTGEFILGHRNEAGELPAAPIPAVLAKNGAFLVFRKLEQDVLSFRNYVAEWGRRYPGGAEKLMAKFLGRWRDGTPLSLSPDGMDAALVADGRRNNDFTYGDDPEGAKCPIGAHIRRVNPRDSLGFSGRLATRRRLIRRGLPYGSYVPEGADVETQERGIIFMTIGASISRQFEFVQQQWVNYGNDFGLGEDRDPIVGNPKGDGRFVIPGDPRKAEEPFVCSGLQSFVTLKGGDYFFAPSLTALRLIAEGLIDPR